MANVVITWTAGNRADPAGSKAADHYHLGLGVLEGDAPLSATTYTFTNVAPGTYQGHGEVVAVDGTELQTPIVFSVIVPVAQPVNIPIVVSIGAIAQ